MKTSKKPFNNNFKDLDSSKKRPFHPSHWGKKHENHQNQVVELNRSNKKGRNLHDLIKKVA
ncbi:MAG: hypothetical protein E2O68_07495 [Deltaproteobacteria bacterium]|nr:MAG: hypothetical protein E2O68_07495 [Deltaproteobacteria bacterium]